MRYLELCTLTGSQIDDLLELGLARLSGSGFGRTLLQRIIDFAGSKLAPIDLRLTSNSSRTEAIALYEALGFKKRDTNVYKMSL